MTVRYRLVLASLLGLAAALTLLRIPLASSQGITLVAAEVSGDLPTTDPNADLWQQTTALQVPLSAQTIALPKLLEATVRSITVRALHNGAQIALLVEWADDTRNDSMVRIQDFRDSVAVQFPLTAGQPFFCMGQAGGDVNIWHWKADWQTDIAARHDLETLYPDMYVDQYPFADPVAGLLAGPADYFDPNYLPALASGNLFASVQRTSPVEDVIAGGFGTLTAQSREAQNVAGFGVWEAGTWRVIFARDLVSADPDDVAFEPGQIYSAAFAAWDGANAERNGRKSTSQWVALQLESSAPVPAGQPAAAPGAAAPGGASQDVLLGFAAVVAPMVLVGLLIFGVTAAIVALALLPDKE